ncbi:gluconokinase [Lapidilactobacillus luobeiensis]|uniref:gluconokinase n=1 Tax=Lapidilactobacillus luobeiensis TaxID=2950371 RepID=UPI0021C2DF1B|nr:gluconokinase [Lapidilactobacillus luobeiensis]
MIIGIDVGTTSTKAILMDKNEQILATAEQGYPLNQAQPGQAEQDPQTIWQAVQAVIADIQQQLPHADTITALSLSTAMHSLLLLDQHWQPLTPIITWADNRAAATVAQLRADPTTPDFYQQTGTPLHPMTPLAKLFWLQATQPGSLRQTAHFADLKSYLVWQLTGEFVLDINLASATGLVAWRTGQWSETILKKLALPNSALPRIVPITTTYPLKPQMATTLALPSTTRLVLGASDGALANIGIGAVHPDQIALTIGTSGAVRVISDRPQLAPQGESFCYRIDTEHWLLGGPVNNGGIILQWALTTLCPDLKNTNDPIAAMIALAAQSPLGAHGLIFLPYLNGERAPFWDGSLSGHFIGLRSQHTRADLLRAILEGITFNLAVVTQQLSTLVPAAKKATLLGTGGFARSPFWCQLISDVFARALVIPDQIQGSALGAARVAQQALDSTQPWWHAQPPIASTTYQPSSATSQMYQRLLPLWWQLAQRSAQPDPDLVAWQTLTSQFGAL